MIVSGFRGCRFEFDNRRIRPQTLQLVVVPSLLIKHMNDHVAVVETHPPGVLTTLTTERLTFEVLLEFAFGIIGQRLHMTVGGSGRDDKHVGDNEKLRHIKQDNIEAFLVIDRGCCDERCFDGF